MAIAIFCTWSGRGKGWWNWGAAQGRERGDLTLSRRLLQPRRGDFPFTDLTAEFFGRVATAGGGRIRNS